MRKDIIVVMVSFRFFSWAKPWMAMVSFCFAWTKP